MANIPLGVMREGCRLYKLFGKIQPTSEAVFSYNSLSLLHFRSTRKTCLIPAHPKLCHVRGNSCRGAYGCIGPFVWLQMLTEFLHFEKKRSH